MTTAARTPLTTPPIALALLAGICACLALPAPAPVAILAALMLVGAGVLWRWPRFAMAAVFALGFALAGLHAAHALHVQIPATPATVDMTLTGRIASLPRQEPRRTVFDFVVDEAPASAVAGRSIRMSWYADRTHAAPALHAGERWQLPARLRAPRGLRNAGAPDGEMHAFADRLAATGYVHGDGVRLSGLAGIDGWRDATSARIGQAVTTPSSRFIRALALGDTRFLADDDWTLLRADGLTHLIAISGFHVGMVAGVAALLVRLLWRLLPMLALRMPARIAAAVAGLVAAIGYAAASGFSLPTVRTLVMIGVVALAQVARRNIAMPQVLATAAIAMLLVDPLSVISAGFWLSFAGVVWLLWCMPRSGISAWKELLMAQGVATLGLLPLTVVLFGQASVAGPVANLLAVPWWSLVVAPLSVAGVALDTMHPTLGALAWRLAAWCFDLAWPAFQTLGSSRFALWHLPEATLPAVAIALVGAFWLMLPRTTPGKPLALLLWLPLLYPDLHRPPQGALEVTAIDVGQGLSVLVRTHHHVLLYDMGPAVPDGFDAGERSVLPTLYAHGINHLDRLVVSHADMDHVGGLAAVRRELPADDLQAPAGSGVVGSRPCLAGQEWVWDGVRFVFLHPPPLFPYLANDSSCVLRIEGHDGTVLLTGDMSSLIERKLVDEDPAAIRADLVFVAHHGSRHSSDPAFVTATHAREAVFSTGHANRFRHPDDVVVERWRDSGARTWNTADTGAVTFRIEAGGIVARAQRQASPRLWDAARREGATAGLSYRRD